MTAEILSQRIIQRLAEADDWQTVDQLTDLAPTIEAPMVAYRHELDDADLGETMAFGQDATGLAARQPRRTRQVPDRDLLVRHLIALRERGEIEDGAAHERAPYEWRLAGGLAAYRRRQEQLRLETGAALAELDRRTEH